MKQILLTLFLMAFFPIAMMAYDCQVGGIYYNLNTSDNTAEVTYKSSTGSSYSGSVVIPSSFVYNGSTYTVTSIGNDAFHSCYDLTSITIPEGVTSIGNQAFYFCNRLTSITIPSSVTSIGDEAFSWCSGLTSLTVEEGNPVYDSRNNCNALIETASNTLIQGCNNTTIPSNVTSIGNQAFCFCNRLTSITIPSSVTSIGFAAFQECSGLTSITIPSSVTSIGDEAFLNCSSLTSITVDEGNPVYDSRNNCNALIKTSSNTLITGCMNTTIPSSVTSIGYYAFSECSGLTSITIPSSVTSIGGGAFLGCSSLTSITIPESVTSIGYGAFYGCSSLPEIDNLRYADTYLVGAVDKTQSSYTIQPGTRFIGSGAFSGCSSLTSITIPSSVTSIGDEAFSWCSGLTSITIPESVTSIEFEVFYGCTSLTSITIPSSVTSIGYEAFRGCSGLTSITIPEGVTSIEAMAFYDCSSLTSITIPVGVTSIGWSAFSGCSSLTSITIPEGVTSIGWGAFSGCSSLTSVTVENPTPISIDEDMFPYRANATLYVPAGTKEVYETAAVWKGFGNIVEMEPSPFIAFTDAKVKALCVANWDTNNDGKLSKDEAAAVTDLGQVFSDKKEITSFKELQYFMGLTRIENRAFDGCSSLTSVTIPNSVTSIGEYAFQGCSSLTSATIPNSVTSIGGSAFSGCSNLTSVIIPNSVTTIGQKAFYNTRIKSLTIGSGVLSISSQAFGYDSSKGSNPIKTIWLTNTPPSGYSYASGTINYVANNLYTSLSNQKVYPFLSSMFDVDGIKYVPISPSDRTCDAFDCLYDKSAENVHVNSSVSYKGVNMAVKSVNPYTCYSNNHIKDVQLKNDGEVGSYAFYECKSILSVNLENNGSVGKQAFANCNNIQTVTASNNGNVETKAFYGCNTLAIVNLSNIGYIGESAFENCDAITTVTASNKGYIAQKAFYDCDAITNINLSNCGNIENQAFYGCNALQTALVKNTGWINNQAFEQCTSLETCTLGNQVTRIYDSSFKNCSKLQQIVIPDPVELIGDYAFSDCSEMKSAIIGCGVQIIPQYAFSNCSSLTNLQVGYNVEQINKYAFNNCSTLPQIEIPASVNSIDNYVFYGCNSLAVVLIADRESELTLGSNGNNPLFSYCPLDSVYIGGNITYNTSSNNGYSPFYRNTSLRTIRITDKETEISPNEFYGCTNLKNVIIGNGVTTIGNWAFSGCSSLKYFAFGSEVETIGQEAFSDCTAMTQIFSSALTPPVCGSQALDDINKWNCTLYVPVGCVSDYQTANQWKEFFFLVESQGNLPEEQSIAFETPSLSYGDENYTLPSQTEQGLTINWSSSDENVAVVSGNTLTIHGAGSCSIVAEQAGNNIYKPIRETYPITIAKAPLKITADNYTRNIGEDNPELSVSYTGFVYDEDETVLSTLPFISTDATTSSPAGVYTITVSGAEADNYDIAYVNGTLTVIDEAVNPQITITSAGMATYCSPYDLDFTNVEGLKAYIITGYDWINRKVYAMRVFDVPAGTGIYLVGKPGDYTIEIGSTGSYYVANMLVGTLAETTINPTDGDLTNLRLTGSSPQDASFKTFTVPRTFSANRAYLQIPTAVLNNSANAVGIVFDDEVDGIDGISQNAGETDNDWFTLDGRKLSVKPTTKGVYVVNGRKVVVR